MAAGRRSLARCWGWLGGWTLAGLLVVGCSGQPPATEVEQVDLATELEQLRQLHDEIRDGFAESGADSVHDALHQVEAALKNVALRAERELDATAKPVAQQAAAAMAELYEKLDAGAHGGQAVGYDEVGDALQRELDRLLELVPGP